MNEKVVTFGEIMLRLATPGYLRFSQADEYEASFGGGEANVAVSLANYGLNTHFVSRLPDNDLGTAAIQRLTGLNVNTSQILKGGERIGIYFLETGAVSRGSKVIYDRNGSSFSHINKGMIDWDVVFRDAKWFHWTGITPAVSQGAADACAEGIKEANKRGITVSTDLNYRKNLWKWGKQASDVMAKLVEGCDIILGNEEDAEKVFGIAAKGVDVTKGHSVDGGAYESVAKQLMERFPRAQKIIITLRGSINANHNTWSAVLYNGNKLLQGPQYDISHIVDRVGGGDSFMGGLIYGLIKWPKDDMMALKFAIAASCLKHTIKGDFNLVTVDEVLKLVEGDDSGRVSR